MEDYGGILSRAGMGLFTVRGTGDEAMIEHKYNQKPKLETVTKKQVQCASTVAKSPAE